MLENKKNIYPNEEIDKSTSKATVGLLLIVVGLIIYNFRWLTELPSESSIHSGVTVVLILLVLLIFIFFKIKEVLSLNRYGETVLQFTCDEVVLGRKIEAQINLAKHVKIEDTFQVTLNNIYTYHDIESAYGETTDSGETKTIWSGRRVLHAIKKEAIFALKVEK